jgi:hypothetical protein
MDRPTGTGERGPTGSGGGVALFVAIYFAVFLVIGLFGLFAGLSAPLLFGAVVQLGVTVLIFATVRRRQRRRGLARRSNSDG